MPSSPWGWRPARLAVLAGLLLASAGAHALVLAVNDGRGDALASDVVRSRYASIAAGLSQRLQQPVTIEPVGHDATLRQGLERKTYDLALVHPAHLSIAALKHSGYQLVAVAKADTNFRVRFLVRADSPLSSLADLHGKRLGAPDEDSITAWVVRATLRDALGDASDVAITYSDEPGAVPFFVENHLTHAGATAVDAVVQAWQAAGGRVLAQSRAVPVWHVIAAPSLSAAQIALVREYLVGLDTSDEGRGALAPSRLPGFVVYDAAVMMAIGRWLGI